MITMLFGVYDKKAEAFMSPFTFHTQGQAIRAFSDTVNDPATAMYRHPDDFDLYQIGLFNDNSGELAPEKHFLLGARSVKVEAAVSDITLIGEDPSNGNSESE